MRTYTLRHASSTPLHQLQLRRRRRGRLHPPLLCRCRLCQPLARWCSLQPTASPSRQRVSSAATRRVASAAAAAVAVVAALRRGALRTGRLCMCRGRSFHRWRACLAVQAPKPWLPSCPCASWPLLCWQLQMRMLEQLVAHQPLLGLLLQPLLRRHHKPAERARCWCGMPLVLLLQARRQTRSLTMMTTVVQVRQFSSRSALLQSLPQQLPLPRRVVHRHPSSSILPRALPLRLMRKARHHLSQLLRRATQSRCHHHHHRQLMISGCCGAAWSGPRPSQAEYWWAASPLAHAASRVATRTHASPSGLSPSACLTC